MTVLRFALLIYGFIGIFVSGGLFFSRASRGSTYLAIFVGLLAVEAFEFLYSTSEVVQLYPYFFLLNFFVSGVIYGPIFLFHFKEVLDKKITWAEVAHFLPAIATIFYLWDIWMLNGLDRITYSQEHFMDEIMPLNYFRASHQLFYGLWIEVLIKRNFQTLDAKKRVYSIAIISIYLIATVFVSWLTEFAESWRGDFIYYYFIAFTLILVIAYLLYSDPKFLTKLSKKYLTSSISKSEMTEIQKQLHLLMEDQKLYLDRELSLRKVSEKLGKTGHQVSQTLSEMAGEGFNDYINRLRVNQARKMLESDEFDHFKIEAIGLESGFNNKVTFTQLF